MDEQPVERRQVVEREEIVERRHVSTAPGGGERRSYAWLWVVLLLLVVGALAAYALTRGEPADLEMPDIGAPELEAPEVSTDPEPNIEIEVNEPTQAPAPEPD